MYIVGIGISTVFNQRIRNTQTEEMRTRRPYRAQLLLFYQFDLRNDTTSHTSLVSFASLGQHAYNTPAFKKQCRVTHRLLSSQCGIHSPICHPSHWVGPGYRHSCCCLGRKTANCSKHSIFPVCSQCSQGMHQSLLLKQPG